MNTTTQTPEFFVLRTPLFSADRLFDVYRQLKTEEPAVVLERILDPIFLEAVYLASPVLYTEVIKLTEKGNQLSQKEFKKIFESVLKYFIRACTRCTPFGLFAGTATGTIKEEMAFDIAQSSIVRNLRIDMDVLCALANRLKNIPEIQKKLTYYPNSTIYRKGKHYKYIEYKYDSTQSRTFHLAEINTNPILKYILEFSRNGRRYQDIIDSVLESYEVPSDDLESYLDELISNNVLYCSIEPNVTGSDFFSRILLEIEAIAKEEPSALAINIKLRDIEKQLLNIREGKAEVKSYQTIYQLFSSIFEQENLNEGKFFQVDTSNKYSRLSLTQQHIVSIVDCVKKLRSLNNRSAYSTTLEKFKRAFAEKYENQSIKITDLFDSETGMGYRQASAMRDYYHREAPVQSSLERIALRKYLDFVNTEAHEIVIDDADLNLTTIADINDDCSIMFSAVSLDNEPEKSLFALHSFSLSSTNLLGRFSHADEALQTQLKKSLRAQDTEDFIVAEIAHLPQSRIGNILSRPVLSNYEIEFLAFSELPYDNKISIDDLYVKIINNELILFSDKLQKRIIPKLSSAHNFSRGSLDIYQFLCDLQFQNRRGMSIWEWGELHSQKYLPRVRFGNCILSSAQWRIDLLEMTRVQKEQKCNFHNAYKILAAKHRYPKIFIVKEADNYLTLDIDTPACSDILEKMLSKKQAVVIFEFLFNTNLSEKDQQVRHNHVNEIVVPIFGNQHISGVNSGLLRINKLKVQRNFYVGDSWVFLKIYCKTKNQNAILRHVDKLVKKFTREKKIQSWFFIRYADPKHHLRLRFLATKEETNLISQIFQGLRPLIQEQIISDIELDTYTRELERYGHQNIEQVEKSFSYNSQMVLTLLKHKKIADSKKMLQRAALFFINTTLSSLQLSMHEKSEFFNRNFKNFAREFNYASDKRLKDTFSQYYRGIRQDLAFLADETLWKDAPELSNTNLLAQADLLKGMSLTQHQRYDVYSSFFHMFINRLYEDQQRFEEFTIYYLLDNHFRSITAQRKALA